MSNEPAPARIIDKDATESIAPVVARHMPAKKLLLVCDDFTWDAAGERIQQHLASGHALTRHSFGKYISARRSLADAVIAQAADHDGLIAIGSGTVNDLTKYAAAQAGKPYLVVATAASMNGYTSANASLEDAGHKTSFAARTPCAVIADTTILAASPKRMTRAGLGDTLCRSTVEADMLLSHHLLGTPYPRELFDTVRRHEAALIAGAATAREGDPAFLHKLIVALLDAGDAMTTHGSSAPASQGEHMIAHTLDMKYGNEMRNILHGELIAVTTLAVNRLQQKIMLGQPMVKRMPRESNQFVLLFGKKLGDGIFKQYQEKILSEEQIAHINSILETDWHRIKTEIIGVMQSPNTIERAFVQSGLAVKPVDLGINEERYRFGCTYGFMTRERFTFLDLAAMNDKRIV